MSLPLPRDFFTCPPLSPGDHGTLLAQAERLCHDTVLNAVTMARAPPTKVLVNAFTKRRAQLHAGTDIYAPEHYGITGSSQIKASYDELYDFFHLNSDDKVRTYGKVLGQAVVDRQTLYNLSAPGATTSPMHAGVQWSVIACPFISSAITLKRDSCFLEVLDTITFDDKATGRRRRGFVRAIHSIALDCCPSLRQSHSIVRSSFVRSGHVFLETSVPGLFDHYFAYVIGDPGLTPKFFNLKVCERMVGQMLNLEPHLALKRLPALLLGGASRPSYRSGARITYCESCDTKFQFLRSKHHCYHCRQFVGAAFKRTRSPCSTTRPRRSFGYVPTAFAATRPSARCEGDVPRPPCLQWSRATTALTRMRAGPIAARYSSATGRRRKLRLSLRRTAQHRLAFSWISATVLLRVAPLAPSTSTTNDNIIEL
ncbi:hypothetical protein SDRG_12178 [Saprolegnia diclina VS20]|uniref:FYVE zinc finger domain-containing protein n=1 Tax=Saprolegnia diclina (strain VS20) TaxID=1156394 RepID=T0RD08_SAPDV|nr:hypothetical protein SDRG_12178 [Saprolegnia diclina VS20]EQC30118.1 hypothetical protein SDRG_12178 [Saprolegnia diclina VS20]|eukprot:XP_008616461.1 hypothetical protein SDRG_12178 [Saprolegnia diclina VS20]